MVSDQLAVGCRLVTLLECPCQLKISTAANHILDESVRGSFKEAFGLSAFRS
jgi:hypothetical protein